MSDLPDFKADEWTRFDLWADRAHEAAQAAIEAERSRGDHNDCTGGLTDAYNRAANIYRALAQSSRPGDLPSPAVSEPIVVVGK